MAAAEALGFPVVLKVESPDMPHKTEAGVIRLEPARRRRGARGFAAIMANAARACRRRRGSTACWCSRWCRRGWRWWSARGVDPLFGPLVVVGLGGILVELLRDTAPALAPVGEDEARAMLRRLKGQRLLEGFRGMPAVDLDAAGRRHPRACREFAADQRDRSRSWT